MSASARGFASDNEAGVHRAVLDAIADANHGHAHSYGADEHTARLGELVHDHFGPDATAFPMLIGTGANVVALQALCQRWEAVICTDHAHVHVDEGGAPEHIGGLKLWTVPATDAKLTPALLDTEAWGFGTVHRAQPGAVSVTQSTELGTVYTADELGTLCDHAHGLGLRVHLDGARLANAAAHLDVPLRALTTDVGVDVVSFGGTKNGALLAEAVVVLDPGLVDAVAYLRKTSMQLASKQRFLSAQLVALLGDDLWRVNASHANAMAARLAAGAAAVPGVRLTQPTQANAVFAVLPAGAADRLRRRHHFYDWDRDTGEVRWMCAWDTTADDVDTFVADLAAAVTGGAVTAGAGGA